VAEFVICVPEIAGYISLVLICKGMRDSHSGRELLLFVNKVQISWVTGKTANVLCLPNSKLFNPQTLKMTAVCFRKCDLSLHVLRGISQGLFPVFQLSCVYGAHVGVKSLLQCVVQELPSVWEQWRSQAA